MARKPLFDVMVSELDLRPVIERMLNFAAPNTPFLDPNDSAVDCSYGDRSVVVYIDDKPVTEGWSIASVGLLLDEQRGMMNVVLTGPGKLRFTIAYDYVRDHIWGRADQNDQ